VRGEGEGEEEASRNALQGRGFGGESAGGLDGAGVFAAFSGANAGSQTIYHRSLWQSYMMGL